MKHWFFVVVTENERVKCIRHFFDEESDINWVENVLLKENYPLTIQSCFVEDCKIVKVVT